MRRLTALTTALALLAGIALGAPAPVAAAVNTIYVGSADDASGASSCADPDFSTDASDEGTIVAALVAALDAVDDNGDTVIICDGDYSYAAFFVAVDAVPFTFSIEAETSGEVTLDGSDDYQMLNLDLGNAVDGHILTIEGMTFENGVSATDGGAVSVTDGSVTVLDSTFTGNTAADYGAALYVYHGDAIVSNTTFTENESDFGALYLENGDATVSDSTFVDNTANEDGAAIYVFRGDATISDSTFTGNSADNKGGASFLYRGDVTISGSTFTGNSSAVDGGALYLSACLDVAISNNEFSSNVAGDNGGGAINFECQDESTEAQITRNVFTNNVAGDYGGATDDDGSKVLVYRNNVFTGNQAIGTDTEGGAVWISDGKFYNNRFTRNRASGDGGAIYIWGKSDYRTAPRNRFSGNRARRGASYYYSR